MKISRRPLAANVPSMAMGDIAFNLLIFFVILAKATDDSHLQWDPAETIDVTRAGAGKGQCGDRRRQQVLPERTTSWHCPTGTANRGQILGSTTGDDRRVLLKVHRDATANHFEPIIEAVSEAGGTLMHVLEEKRIKK